MAEQQNLQPLVVWWIDDGKPGHRNQTLGLLQALSQYRRLESHALSPQPFGDNLLNCLGMGDLPNLPTPDLLLAAGHATHFTLFALKRRTRAKALLLMKPSLLVGCFDGIVMPEHDGLPSASNRFISKGALNRIVPGSEHEQSRGLILVGGPSRHYDWDESAVLAQIRELLARPGAEMSWQLADSRRTPESFKRALKELATEYCPCEDTASEALQQMMQRAGQIWVTPDSVSMVYEALTSGARVGLFSLPANAKSRVAKGVEGLVAGGLVQRLGSDQGLAIQDKPLWEADRAARWLLERYEL